jgi:hypothetical protein
MKAHLELERPGSQSQNISQSGSQGENGLVGEENNPLNGAGTPGNAPTLPPRLLQQSRDNPVNSASNTSKFALLKWILSF